MKTSTVDRLVVSCITSTLSLLWKFLLLVILSKSSLLVDSFPTARSTRQLSSNHRLFHLQPFQRDNNHGHLQQHQDHQHSYGCRSSSSFLKMSTNANSNHPPIASIVGYVSPFERDDLVNALQTIGYTTVVLEEEELVVVSSSSSLSSLSIQQTQNYYQYSYIKATGMLKYVGTNDGDTHVEFEPPQWVPAVRGEENVLVANGWSFLDPDESEPNSAFDVDAANEEGLYIPKWGIAEDGEHPTKNQVILSDIGYDIRRLSSEEVVEQANHHLVGSSSTMTKSVLLEGATDPPNIKMTHNGYDFSGSASQSSMEKGIFVCAIGGLPLFTTLDVSPTTASSGWLSFSSPLSKDHVILVHPVEGALDSRIEVLCAKSGCHLGHYFGKGQGYCINASALNFIPTTTTNTNLDISSDKKHTRLQLNSPISWRMLEAQKDTLPSIRNLYNTLLDKDNYYSGIHSQTITFGGGCFWHVEHSLRRLPGIITTKVGYAGGATPSPSYQDVCKKNTGHAEVVQVVFDSRVLEPRMLIDCFLALHDPTKVRALGKHAQGTGQYRSCIFVTNSELEIIAKEALKECSTQLDKVLSTEVRNMGAMEMDNTNNQWFWVAEERHQRHDERKSQAKDTQISTMTVSDWLLEYAKRSESIWGSTQTIKVDDSSDDGMARMMI